MYSPVRRIARKGTEALTDYAEGGTPFRMGAYGAHDVCLKKEGCD